ncbi:hypothetical protein Tco_0960819 [Tanacetum coccineum]
MNDKPYRPPSTQNEQVDAVFTRSGLTYDPSVNPNAKTTVIYDDSDDEVDKAEKEVEPSSSKQTKSDPLPLKAYKLKIPYPQRLHVIDEVTEEELDALLDDSKPFSTTSEKISESSLDHEFEEFMAIKIEEIPEQEEEIKNSFKVLPFEGNQRIKNSIQEPPTDLVMKPLPEHLEYAFLEKYSLLPVVISALLQDDEKKSLVSVLKKHKEAFAWKTFDILGISPSFGKQKINLEDDAKPVIQRQH